MLCQAELVRSHSIDETEMVNHSNKTRKPKRRKARQAGRAGIVLAVRWGTRNMGRVVGAAGSQDRRGLKAILRSPGCA